MDTTNQPTPPSRKIFNCTPHPVRFIDRFTHKYITTYEPCGVVTRLDQAKMEPTEYILGLIPVKPIGKYTIDAQTAVLPDGVQDGDILIVSTLLAQEVVRVGIANVFNGVKVRLMVPSSGPGDCIRDSKGNIEGVFDLYEYS